MCDCVDVVIGSYTNTVEVQIPPHMEAYRQSNIARGLAGTICLDLCVEEEIKSLWAAGITTYGCCCGHNKVPSMVNVDEKDIEAMLAMGYVQNHPDPSRKDTFKLKSA